MLSPSMRTARRRMSLVATVVVLVATIGTLAPPATAATAFTFTGRGWGHGLGMSQWGARGMAERGSDASSILRHYYAGTKVEPKTAPSTVRVGLLQERAEVWIEGDGRFDLHDRTGALRASGTSGQRWRIVPQSGKLSVFAPGASTPSFRTTVPVTVRFEQHSTLLSLPQTGHRYRHGRLDVDINPATEKTRAILIVPFERYLYGLGEMPSSWPTAALQAQAIAGRTYALEKVTRLGQQRAVCNCGVYATTVDQAYVGVQHEVPRWVAAVDATAGKVVTYGGKPIQALYSSSSGGYTEHNENVFGGSPLPYLRGRCDTGDWAGGENPHSNWSVTLDADEVEERLSDAGHDVGSVRDIRILSPRGVSGRVLAVQDRDSGGILVDGSTRDARLSGSTFRSIMGLKSNLIAPLLYGGIRVRYDAMSCKPGIPTTNESTWRDPDGTDRGRAQDFTQGRMTWNRSTSQVLWTSAGFTERYDSLRSKGFDLGMPTSDTVAISGGKRTTYERGHLYWRSANGVHEVHGAILERFLSSGGTGKWGFPTTDELRRWGGASTRFDRARIYWTSRHGAHVLYGAIGAKYVEVGEGASELGMPTSGEYGVSVGRRVNFEHGTITWNRSTKATTVAIA